MMARQRLDTWKQIADYLGCSERTAKRHYDKGMPVYQLASLLYQRVFAYSDELDRWVHQGKHEIRALNQPENPNATVSLAPKESPISSAEVYLRLVPVEGVENKTAFLVHQTQTVLGRDIHAQIVLSDPRISRRHACLYREGISFFLEDLESRNGTLLNDSRLDGRALLRHGDRINLGGKVSLLVQLVTTGETVELNSP